MACLSITRLNKEGIMRSLFFVLIGSLILGASFASESPASSTEFSGYSGEQLVEKLLDPMTCSKAFYELSRR